MLFDEHTYWIKETFFLLFFNNQDIPISYFEKSSKVIFCHIIRIIHGRKMKKE